MSNVADNRRRWLKPEVLARLGSLDLIARTVVDGTMQGMHRSPNFGQSQDFAEYRSYNDGDDLRFIDWNVFARSDKMFIKRYRGETNSAVNLILDSSASMGFGSTTTKLDYARYLLASIAFLSHRQKDALGLMTVDEGVRELMEPTSRNDSLTRALGVLQNTEAGNGTELAKTIDRVGVHLQKRGVVVLVSDLYGEPEQLLEAFQKLSHLGHDVAIFRVLDPEEIKPSVNGISTMIDVETTDRVIVSPDFINRGYQKKFKTHAEALELGCQRLGIDLVNLQTDQAVEEALFKYIQFREQRSR